MSLNAALGTWGLDAVLPETEQKFAAFQGLLEHWNARINLTSNRNPEEQIRRHLLESVFCARSLPAGIRTLLDFGSGAGFPGIPVAICCPEVQVTLGESQGKKAAFLSEAIRTLALGNTKVFGGRIEEMEPTRLFDAVTMRAVDKMEIAVGHGAERVAEGGFLVLFSTAGLEEIDLPGFERFTEVVIPESERRILRIGRRSGAFVPRGTQVAVS